MNTMKTTRQSAKLGLLTSAVLGGLSLAPHAWADTVAPTVVLSQSTMVLGSESTTDSFVAPSAGTMTVTLDSFGWAAPLSALSFSASSANHVLASLNTTGVIRETATFNVAAGSYFANIMATASGAMDVGLYSLKMTFTPSVPLPASGWMLLTGMFVLAGLLRVVRPFELTGTAGA
jgi:hypothetical protein